MQRVESRPLHPRYATMNRLQSELHRLYLLQPSALADEAQAGGLVSVSGTVRAMVMELAHPPSWELLSKVWYGVQAELDLPAPAIAVSGTDGIQLWFSLAEPVTALRAHGFLERLRLRFLPEVDARRLRLMPAADASAQRPELHASLVPAQQLTGDNWSAFVAPDLAPVFVDTPWLDIPPSNDGQAALLQGIKLLTPAAFEAAIDPLDANAPVPVVSTEPRAAQGRQASAAQDAEQFLLQVMRDDAQTMALRIEAAKVLLQAQAGPRV